MFFCYFIRLLVFVYSLANDKIAICCVCERERGRDHRTDSMMITYFCQFSQLTYVHCREYHLNQKSKMADIVSLMLFYTYFSFWYVNMHTHSFVRSPDWLTSWLPHSVRAISICSYWLCLNKNTTRSYAMHCIHTFILWWLTAQYYYTLDFGIPFIAFDQRIFWVTGSSSKHTTSSIIRHQWLNLNHVSVCLNACIEKICG